MVNLDHVPDIWVGGQQYKAQDIAMEVSYNREALSTELNRMPLVLVKWSRLAAVAKGAYEHSIREFAQWKAQKGDELKARVAEEGGKKPTGGDIEAHYRTHADYEGWSKYVSGCEESWIACEGVKSAAEKSCSMIRMQVELHLAELRIREGAVGMPQPPPQQAGMAWKQEAASIAGEAEGQSPAEAQKQAQEEVPPEDPPKKKTTKKKAAPKKATTKKTTRRRQAES